MAEGENDKNATQTLAAATDEQMETMDAWDHQKEDTEDGSEDEHGMDCEVCVVPVCSGTC